MGKSRTVTVTVIKAGAELTIGLDRVSGFPGTIQILGSLYEAGTINVIRSATVELYINGLKVATTTTSSSNGGRYSFSHAFGVGVYDVFTVFPGNETYLMDQSDLVRPEYAKVDTDLTIDVNPLAGAPPLAVTITGRLSRSDTTVGLGGKTVELWRNGVKIKTATTKTSTPLGIYTFSDTISAQANYYVYFAGDSQFEGCEAGDGSTVVDGDENGEPPVVADWGPALVLALLVLSQE